MLTPPAQAPLLTPELVNGSPLAEGARIETVADPFPLSVGGQLFVLAEIEGRRRDGAYFKQIGAFAVADGLSEAAYLGEVWPADGAEYSFPSLTLDGDQVLMSPDVTRRFPRRKEFRLLECAAVDFPFGWRPVETGGLPGAVAACDKLLLPRGDGWLLLVSDATRGGRLLLYRSDDLRTWEPHPASPLLVRRVWHRALRRWLPGRMVADRPWRLGGGSMRVDGRTCVFLQHGCEHKVYGEAVTPLEIEVSDDAVVTRLAGSPVLRAQPDCAWRRVSAHHVAFAQHGDGWVVATDGFDGRVWRSSVQPFLPPAGMELEPVRGQR